MPIDGTLQPDEPLPSATTFEAVEYIDRDVTLYAAVDGSCVTADDEDDHDVRRDEAWGEGSWPQFTAFRLHIRVPRPVEEIDAGTFTIRPAAPGAPVTVALRDEVSP